MLKRMSCYYTEILIRVSVVYLKHALVNCDGSIRDLEVKFMQKQLHLF